MGETVRIQDLRSYRETYTGVRRFRIFGGRGGARFRILGGGGGGARGAKFPAGT